jgi:hypothetical protein
VKLVTERTDPVGGIDEQALVAPLEKMPALAPVPVEAQGKGALPIDRLRARVYRTGSHCMPATRFPPGVPIAR